MMRTLVAILLSLAAIDCGEPSFYCQHAPPTKPLVFSAEADLSPAEEAAFLAGAAHWHAWVGATVTLDRSLPFAPPRLTKVLPPAEAAWDATTHEAVSYTLYAAEEETDIWFVRSRIDDAELETVLTHEIGHALGLGHVTESGSLMYLDPKKFDGLTAIDHTDMAVCYTDKL